MKLRYIALISTLFIFGCGGSAKPSATQATPIPPTQQLLQPSTEIPPTAAVADPNYFRDDFDTNLATGWQWLNENPNNWSLTAVPGNLQINVDGGQVSDETITNLL